MVSQGVKRSLKLITAKSCISGAPRTAPPERAAVIPGITSISTSGCFSPSSRIGPAIPYIPASPLQIITTDLPFSASAKAISQRSISRFMGVVRNSLSGKYGFASST